MSIFPLYSKRQKATRGQMDDIFSYDKPSQQLRVKIIHIINDALGDQGNYFKEDRVRQTYKQLVEILCREYGVFILSTGDRHDRNYYTELVNFILQEEDVEKFLDAVELAFKAIDKISRSYNYMPPYSDDGANERADQAIEEFNDRLKEHNFGYQYQDSKIIRVDSEFIHAEAVKPALRLLGESKYSGAKQEFLSGHEHYRQGKNKEALADSLKALESTMKVICAKRKWPHDPTKDTASKLIQICFDKELIPLFWQNHFSALRATLESGVPTGRNKLSGHGQGTEIIDVPNHIAAYVLHQTAATIVFLIEAKKNLK